MTKKLEQSKIDEIKRLSKEWLSRKEIADLLGVWSTSVNKYLRWTEETKQEIVEAITETNHSRDEIKKLKLIEKFTPQELKELLYQVAISWKNEINENPWEPWYLKLLIISDEHINDKHHREDAFAEMWRIANEENVDAWISAWDITAGMWVYKWQVFDLKYQWVDEQLENCALQYTKLKDWKKIYMINWNHEESILKICWLDFQKELNKIRPDLVNLWTYNADITLNNIKVWVQHWAKWPAYAISYHLQKYVEKMEEWKCPDVFVLWHYHWQLIVIIRWILCVMPWTFQWLNWLTRRMWYTTDNIWFCIAEILKEKDKKIFNPKLYKF